MSRTLFLDLDGVLADFDQHVLNLSGYTPAQLERSKQLWPFIMLQRNFWLTIPPAPEAMQLWEAIYRFEPIILTGVPRSGRANAEAQKRAWVAQYLGTQVPVITCFSREKPDHMKAPGDVLLDDRLDNRERWKEVGGIALPYVIGDHDTHHAAIQQIAKHMEINHG
jgi:hypothetical protein